MKKLVSTLLAVVMVFSLCAVSAFSEPAKGTEAYGNALLKANEGTYIELFPVMYQPKYDQVWKDAAASVVPADKVDETVNTIRNMDNGTLYGQAAIDAYKGNTGFPKYFCGFIHGPKEIQIAKNGVIRGYDEKGTTVFSHKYHFVGYDKTRNFYEFMTDDDSTYFKYFVFADDTNDTTYHIEFRYGDNLDDLLNWTEGKYAFWIVGALLKGDREEELATKSIQTLVKEVAPYLK